MALAYPRPQGASLPNFPLLLAALAGFGTPAIASPAEDAVAAPASRWALPPANLTKRAALLGGESAMAQILAQQGSPVRLAAAVEFAPPAPLQPAAAAAATISPAVFRPTLGRPADRPAANGAPNVFGSVALAIGSTPLDAQWRRATAARQVGAWTGAFPSAHSGNREAVLREVNAWVNQRIVFTDDVRNSGEADRWAGAAESLRSGRGDCEDYALAKMQLLQALGFESDRLFLVVARDLVRRADHALLVVQLDDRFVVLDNNTDAVLESSAVGDYRPVMSYSAAGRWIHGYAAEPRPIQIAAAASNEASAP